MISFFYDSYQLILFFLFPGIFLGIIYDVFRILRIARTNSQESVLSRLQKHFSLNITLNLQNEKRQKLDRIFIFVEDLIFCLMATLVELLLFYHLNNGVIRIYGLLLTLLGFILYHNSFGKIVIYMAKNIIYLFRNILYWILLILFTPIVFVYRKSRSIVKNHKNKDNKTRS